MPSWLPDTRHRLALGHRAEQSRLAHGGRGGSQPTEGGRGLTCGFGRYVREASREGVLGSRGEGRRVGRGFWWRKKRVQRPGGVGKANLGQGG